MAGSQKTIGDLFEHAIEIEYKAAQIYEELLKLFPHVPGLAAFWQEMREDELEHTKILQETQQLLTPEQLMMQPGGKIWENIAVLLRMLDQNPVAEVKSLDDAFELAHEIESTEVNAIFRFLAVECVPSDKRKRFVLSVIEQHLKRLSDFGERFGDRSWRRDINIQRR